MPGQVRRGVLGKVLERVVGKVLVLVFLAQKEGGEHFPEQSPEHTLEHLPGHTTPGLHLLKKPGQS